MVVERGNATECVYPYCTHAFMCLISVEFTCNTRGPWSVSLGNRSDFGFRGSADSQGWQETCNVGPGCPRQHWQDHMPLDQMQFCAHIITDKASAGLAQTLRELLLALKTEWGLWKFSPTFTVGINLGQWFRSMLWVAMIYCVWGRNVRKLFKHPNHSIFTT